MVGGTETFTSRSSRRLVSEYYRLWKRKREVAQHSPFSRRLLLRADKRTMRNLLYLLTGWTRTREMLLPPPRTHPLRTSTGRRGVEKHVLQRTYLRSLCTPVARPATNDYEKPIHLGRPFAPTQQRRYQPARRADRARGRTDGTTRRTAACSWQELGAITASPNDTRTGPVKHFAELSGRKSHPGSGRRLGDTEIRGGRSAF